jgi:hypothetical protein
MIRRAAAGLAGLGLIGGAGTVIYNNSGDATVKIKDNATGKVQTVRIAGGNGRSFSCPDGERAKLEPYVIRLGRIKLTLRQVRREERKIEQQYPSDRAPHRVVVRYNALGRRDDRLVAAYNAEVDTHNAIIDRDCTPAD